MKNKFVHFFGLFLLQLCTWSFARGYKGRSEEFTTHPIWHRDYKKTRDVRLNPLGLHGLLRGEILLLPSLP